MSSPAGRSDADRKDHILLPKWFLRFLSVLIMIMSIGVIPWASSVTSSLARLSEEVARLAARLDGQVNTNSEALRGLNLRIDRIEHKLDRLEERNMPEIACRCAREVP